MQALACIALVVLGPWSLVLGPGARQQTSFDAFEKDVRAGVFGYTDRVLVLRDGKIWRHYPGLLGFTPNATQS